jgi:hypothetical protein
VDPGIAPRHPEPPLELPRNGIEGIAHPPPESRTSQQAVFGVGEGGSIERADRVPQLGGRFVRPNRPEQAP